MKARALLKRAEQVFTQLHSYRAISVMTLPFMSRTSRTEIFYQQNSDGTFFSKSTPLDQSATGIPLIRITNREGDWTLTPTLAIKRIVKAEDIPAGPPPFKDLFENSFHKASVYSISDVEFASAACLQIDEKLSPSDQESSGKQLASIIDARLSGTSVQIASRRFWIRKSDGILMGFEWFTTSGDRVFRNVFDEFDTKPSIDSTLFEIPPRLIRKEVTSIVQRVELIENEIKAQKSK